MYTMFPHDDYPSLNSLMRRLKDLNVEFLFIANGTHTIESYKDDNYVNIDFPITIVGESREQCIVVGGLRMIGTSSRTNFSVHVSNLTIRGSKYSGVCGKSHRIRKLPPSFHLDNISIENSQAYGVEIRSNGESLTTAFKRVYNSMNDCHVINSQLCGVSVSYTHLTLPTICSV